MDWGAAIAEMLGDRPTLPDYVAYRAVFHAKPLAQPGDFRNDDFSVFDV
jgi:hypothetical protein